MKMKQLVTTAAVFVALAMAAPSAYALTAAQAKAVKKAVTSVSIPEMPAKAVELVLAASKEDRQGVAITAVRAAIYKSRSSAPLVVAAVSKSAPDLAPVISQAAAEMEVQQASVIARAAVVNAPQAKTQIVASVNRGVAQANATVVEAPNQPTTSQLASTPESRTPRVRPQIVSRPQAETETGDVIQSNEPIGESGGNGGTFVGAPANPAPQPQTRPYGTPRPE